MPPSSANRDFVLHEANLLQLRHLKPNVAVLPWGAAEAHNYHLPHGTDVIEAVAIAELAIERANKTGSRCVMLPCVPVYQRSKALVTPEPAGTSTLRYNGS